MSEQTLDTKKRIVAIFIVIVFAFVVIVGRVFWLQFIEGPSLQKKANEQWAKDQTIKPHRGDITDRNGNILAKTVSSDTVVLRPQEIKKAGNIDNVVDELATILEIDKKEVRDRADSDKSEIWLERQINSDQKESIKRLNLKGVGFVDDNRRSYVYGDFLTQTLGMTNIDGKGLSGVESIYDKYLAGEPGKIKAETDNAGRPLPYSDEKLINAVDGYNVELTVDYAIQSFLENSLADAVDVNKAKSATGIVMDPNTGEILAVSTKPGYDLNNPPRDDVKQMEQLSRNKAITDSYELGSVMKTLTLSAVIEEETFEDGHTFYCPGYRIVDGEKIFCHADVPHGTMNMTQAAMKSCNPAFMDMGIKLGREKYFEYLDKFGLQKTTGINFPGEAAPQIPHVKYANNRELARYAFGQSIAVSPLQMTTAFSAMVNGGNLLKPYMVKEIKSQEGEIIQKGETEIVGNPISKGTSDEIRKMMSAVVNQDGGSGSKAAIPGYNVGGKTGTASKYENGQVAKGKYITSFLAVAPADDPKLVCLIMVDEPQVGEHLYGSLIAAPVAKQVLENSLKYLNVPAKNDTKDGKIVQVKVPSVIGLSSAEATSKLKAAGFKVQLVGEEGKIEKQLPVAETNVSKGSSIMIYTANTSGGVGAGRE